MNVIHSGMLKIRAACVMPMYSVTSVSQLINARSKTENQPHTGPKASKMASAWPALGDGSQADRHFLDVVRHRHEDDERPQQVEPGPRARLRVGRNPAGVVVGDHRDDAGPDHGEQDHPASLQAREPMNDLADPEHDESAEWRAEMEPDDDRGTAVAAVARSPDEPNIGTDLDPRAVLRPVVCFAAVFAAIGERPVAGWESQAVRPAPIRPDGGGVEMTVEELPDAARPRTRCRPVRDVLLRPVTIAQLSLTLAASRSQDARLRH